MPRRSRCRVPRRRCTGFSACRAATRAGPPLPPERITGQAPDGREGSVTIQHGGLESDPDAWFGQIVPNTGTGGFAGWSGTARICHDDDGAYFEIRRA
ncbi:MAG TPA: DUF3224 domain-containing protein [Streptosporangiaceae bacterium]